MLQKIPWGSLCILLILGTALPAAAQITFSGTVADAAQQQPVPAATIVLSGPVDRSTHTDASGHYQLSGLPEGAYSLEIRCLGYRASKSRIRLPLAQPLTTALQPIDLFIAPVEITSTRAGANAPFTKTELSGEALAAKNLGQDLPYLLKQQPSVFTTSDAGAGVGYTNLWIRGSDISRVNVTFNGIPVNDAESSGAFFVDIPDIASSTNSVQIQRGVGTSTNGSGAFGATLNLSTNSFQPDPYGSIMSSYGSFNTWKHSVKAGSGLLNNHFTIDARLSSVTSDGYIDRASADLKSYYLSAAYFGKKTALRFNIFSGKETTYQAWNGVPEDSLKAGNRTYNGLGLMSDGRYYDNQTDNYTQSYYQLFWNQEINSRWAFNVATFLTRGKGYYEEYEMDEAYAAYGLPNPIFGNDTLKTTDLVRDLWLDNYYYGTVFSLHYKQAGFASTLGGGATRYDGKHYGEVIWADYGFAKDYRYYYNKAYKNDVNLYWKGSLQLTAPLTAFLDLQYRWVLYDINGFKHHPDIHPRNRYGFFNPKAGLAYVFGSGNRLYGSYAIAHKEPNRDDFEANTEHPPKAEQMGDVEIGYDRKGKIYTLHGGLYYMHYRNQLVLTGAINDVGAYTRTNAQKSYRLGVEVNGSLRWANIFTLQANAAFSRNRIRDFTEYLDDFDQGGNKQQAIHHGETPISFSPAFIAGASLSVEPFAGFRATLNGKYVGKRYLDNSGSDDRSLDPYLTNGLELHYSLHPKGLKGLSANLLIDNLFDVDYLTNGYTYAYIADGSIQTDNSYFPQAGIHFLFGITLDL